MTVPSALTCRDVRKRYGDTVAVDGVDLDVARGSVTALLGPSGCGKTTVLRMAAGLLDPDSGEISLDGRLVDGPGVHVPAERRGVGMVFQDHALFPHLSVGRNVAYGLRGRSRRARRARVAEVLELVGLAGLGDRLPSQLSGGQQQRVALARALAPEPAIVLLDEPFSNLDAALRARIREEVVTILRTAGATALLVTHDQEEALSLADRVAVMEAGRLHQVAAPHTLYTRPATRFVATFVGDATLVPGRASGTGHVDTALGRLPVTTSVSDAIRTVVVRPDMLRLTASDQGSATVVDIAYFGHDQLVGLELADGSRLRARRGPHLDLAPGDRVEVDVDGPVVTFADTHDARPELTFA